MTRGEIWLVNLDPPVGSEIRKTRPCVVVSPAEIHDLHTVLVAPVTTAGREAPFRIGVTHGGRKGPDPARSGSRRRQDPAGEEIGCRLAQDTHGHSEYATRSIRRIRFRRRPLLERARTGEPDFDGIERPEEWLGRRDSNPDTQLQRLQSYR